MTYGTGYREAIHTVLEILKGSAKMAKYRITIERIDDGIDEAEVVNIFVTTNYTIARDLAEWAKEEVDTDAVITFGRSEI